LGYLASPRLVFYGRFQADVSTVNNDVRHFSNDDWEARFQEFQRRVVVDPATGSSATQLNGWWNPPGTGAFRIVDATVRSATYADGVVATTPDDDPIVGANILGATGRSAGKIVDIDPQWQLASALWGLGVRAAPSSGPDWFRSEFLAAPFRDLTFSRSAAGGGDGGASATFPSRLIDVIWGADADRSRLLRELRAASLDHELSIRLMTYGYQTSSRAGDFTYGLISGVIGPARADEPKRFVFGRRMVAANSNQSSGGFNFFDATFDDTTGLLLLDLSNALPLDSGRGPFTNLGELRVAVLQDAGGVAADDLVEGAHLLPSAYVSLGSVPYLNDGWLETTGAVHAVVVPEHLRGAVATQPLALLTRPSPDGSAPDAVIAIRESKGGRAVRIDDFVKRVEAHTTVQVDVWASRYGRPAVEAISIVTGPPLAGLGGSGQPDEYDAPRAAVPVANTPTQILSLPTQVTTDEAGHATFSIGVGDPGNPRGYLEGQLYVLQYNLARDPIAMQQFDLLTLLVHDAMEVPEHPTWTDIQPWMQQYANLYPIMSRMLVDLADHNAVLRMRSLMELAFSLPIEDPNHMPVTRDLSDPRRATILKWLRQFDPTEDASDAASIIAVHAARARAVSRVAATPTDDGTDAPRGGKSSFYDSLHAALRGV
jgi:hypothetical protein